MATGAVQNRETAPDGEGEANRQTGGISPFAKAIEQVDRLARAGVNYALVVVGLSIVVATLTLLGAEAVTQLSTAQAVALIAGGGLLAAAGAVLQNRSELAVKREMAAVHETELNASNRRLELTQQVLIEQLKQWSTMTEAEKDALEKKTTRLVEVFTASTLWPSRSGNDSAE